MRRHPVNVPLRYRSAVKNDRRVSWQVNAKLKGGMCRLGYRVWHMPSVLRAFEMMLRDSGCGVDIDDIGLLWLPRQFDRSTGFCGDVPWHIVDLYLQSLPDEAFEEFAIGEQFEAEATAKLAGQRGMLAHAALDTLFYLDLSERH